MNSLGETAQEIYRGWEKCKPGPGQIVLGRVVPVGEFSWLYGRIIKHERTGRGIATYRLANTYELEEIDWAVLNGAIQIEAVPVGGVRFWKKHQSPINTECGSYIYHKATGKRLTNPLPLIVELSE